MKTDGHFAKIASDDELSGIKITSIYEDFATGARAHGFAGRLAERLGDASPSAASLWRSELLAWPPVAADAADAAADCDFLIVSLRGDRLPPPALREWIEARLDDLAAGDGGLIVLLDSDHATQSVVAAIRCYFRSVCAAKGVAFYSHTVTPPLETSSPRNRRGGQTDGLTYPERPGTPALLCP